MLREIGIRSVDELFAPIPAEYRLNRDLDIAPSMAESDILDWFKQRASENATGYTNFLGAETVGVDPRRLGLGAVAAAEKLLTAHGARARDIAAIEFNEAFAGQVLACTDRLGLDDGRVDRVLNTEGGALALGHAYGASGAVSVVRLLARAQHLPDGALCLAMISSAGGIGTAALFAATRLG